MEQRMHRDHQDRRDQTRRPPQGRRQGVKDRVEDLSVGQRDADRPRATKEQPGGSMASIAFRKCAAVTDKQRPETRPTAKPATRNRPDSSLNPQS